jgi:hypothetical protein
MKGSTSSPGLPDDVNVRKAIFMFNTKHAVIVSKIDAANVCDLTSIHIWRVLSQRSDTHGRDGVLPKTGSRTRLSRRNRSLAGLQAGYECLRQVPSSNEKKIKEGCEVEGSFIDHHRPLELPVAGFTRWTCWHAMQATVS